MEKGHERRGNPFTPSPGNVFSCVTRVAWRIFHPDRGRVITTAPGNSFWSKERILGARDARTSIMRRLRGQEGARKGPERLWEGIEKDERSFTPQLCRGLFATRVSRGEFTARGKEGRLPRRCIEVFSAKIEFGA